MSGKNWQNKKTKALFKVIAKVKSEKEAARFFRDLCTLDELNEMAIRWQAVIMLKKGKPYREIAQKTGLSTTTVTRVAYWLNYGEGGYRSMLSRLMSKKSQKSKVKNQKFMSNVKS